MWLQVDLNMAIMGWKVVLQEYIWRCHRFCTQYIAVIYVPLIIHVYMYVCSISEIDRKPCSDHLSMMHIIPHLKELEEFILTYG